MWPKRPPKGPKLFMDKRAHHREEKEPSIFNGGPSPADLQEDVHENPEKDLGHICPPICSAICPAICSAICPAICSAICPAICTSIPERLCKGRPMRNNGERVAQEAAQTPDAGPP